jgi:hypothetical protein
MPPKIVEDCHVPQLAVRERPEEPGEQVDHLGAALEGGHGVRRVSRIGHHAHRDAARWTPASTDDCRREAGRLLRPWYGPGVGSSIAKCQVRRPFDSGSTFVSIPVATTVKAAVH